MPNDRSIDAIFDRMAIGYYDQDDVDRLIRAYRDLRIATMMAVAVVDRPDEMLIKSGIHAVLARHGYLLPFDHFAHAPRCPANHWSKTMVPHKKCDCGAAQAFYLNPKGRRLQDEGKLTPEGWEKGTGPDVD